MKIYEISPGNWLAPSNDSSGKLSSPYYYVFFWSVGEDGYFTRECFKIVGAKSVKDVILWQEDNANSRISAALLPVPGVTDTGTSHVSLYLLNGEYPQGIEVEPTPDFGWNINSNT